MIDVHAPDHRVSGTRDFFVHLFTITVGLLIALGLENVAEAWHHHHLRREAEENIRVELERNLTKLKDALPRVTTERDNMVRVIQVLDDRSHNKANDGKGLQVSFEQSPMDDAAWRTAASTGALSYMPYAQVQTLSVAYKEQDMLDAASQKAIGDYLELGSYFQTLKDPKEIDALTAVQALPTARRVLADLNAMLALGDGTEGAYKEALGRK